MSCSCRYHDHSRSKNISDIIKYFPSLSEARNLCFNENILLLYIIFLLFSIKIELKALISFL